jgi:antagonist of KipI
MIGILKSGILDTFQDVGRFGFAKWGVNNNGAMDTFASRVANALVGNALEATVLEIHFPGPEVIFLSDSLICLTGADFAPSINGTLVPVWKSIQVPAGAVLTFEKKVKGMRSYLSIHGGFDLSAWLSSSSTNLKSKTGGLHGRALKQGDEIASNEPKLILKNNSGVTVFPWSVNHSFVYSDERVKIVRGNEWDWLDETSARQLLSGEITVESSSDRMASFLRHDPIKFVRNDQLLSSAVTFGTIQALPSGKLCVLMADHQTTGGYPRIAHIASAHLPKFSQLRPGEMFTISQTTVEEAEKMLLSLQSSLQSLQKNLHEKLLRHYGVN